MAEDSSKQHPSASHAQQEAEKEILTALERELGVSLGDRPSIDLGIELDGFHDGDPAVCVEIYARQGKLKGSQPAKLMSDMCRLMLVERLLYQDAGRRCRKVLGCSNPEVIRRLSNGTWRHRFVEEFGIEPITVDISDETRKKLEDAQVRQRR